MKRLLKNKFILFGSIVILLMVLLAVFAPLLTPYDYAKVDLPNKHQPPSASHILGTDPHGRDVWTRIIYGARISLSVAFISVAIAIVCGSFLGVVSGFFKGPVDFVLGRLNDVMMAFPPLLLSLIIGVVLGASLRNMYFSIGIPLIPMFYRVARGATMTVTERTFITAARSIGSGRFRIIFHHVVPNVLPQIFVVLSLSMGSAILAEASLGFLGLGIPQPTPSWGLIVNEGKLFMFSQPWTTAFSGAFIALTILGFNLLGDGLRDYLDPKLRTLKD